MRWISACAIALALAGAARAEEDGAANAPADPRIAEAGALLDSKDEWPRAIALYEAVLADAPGNAQARLWAARVRAWNGDYDAALAHFAALQALPEPPPSAEIERAEVLSWAGRTAEAEAAFQRILEREPENARALRGLARSYRWSGQLAKADRAYQQSLELEDDEKAREELDAMRAGPRWLLENDTAYFSDSDEFHKYRSEVLATRKLDYDTALRARLRFTAVDQNQRNDQRGWNGTLGLERRFPHKLRAALDLGGIEWDHARDRFTGRAELGWSAPTGGSLTFSLTHGDLLAYTGDVDAIDAGIASTALRASIWQPISEAWAVYASGEIAFFSDDNRRHSIGASLDYQPWQGWDLFFSLGADWAGYSRDPADPNKPPDSNGVRPNLYYSPDDDLSIALSARLTQPLGLGFEAWIRPSIGYGYAREDGFTGESMNFGVEGGPRWRHASGFWIGLEGHYARTQRADGYNHHGAGLAVGREF